MRRSTRVVSILAAALFLAAMAASPAHAHVKLIYQGDDNAIISADHRTVTVYDVEKDGNYVFAQVYRGDVVVDSVRDSYGGGGTSETVPSGVTHFMLVEASDPAKHTDKIPV